MAFVDGHVEKKARSWMSVVLNDGNRYDLPFDLFKYPGGTNWW